MGSKFLYPSFVVTIVLLFICNSPLAQTGASGNTGGEMNALGYINYQAALGTDQQISNNGNVTIGPNGNVDIYGSLQVDNGSTLEIKSGAVLNLYGDMKVNGTLAIESGATINYYGKNWTNGNTAQVTNNGTVTGTPGNAVNFITPQLTVPSSYTANTSALSAYSGATQMQNIDGGDIAMHIVMHVQNTSNINLVNSNTRLSGQLSFDVSNGYLITNSKEFVFTETASWSGANTDRYIQTNTSAGMVRKIGLTVGSSFLFPVGYSIPGSYSPANISATSGNTDNYHVNVNDFTTSPPNEFIINPYINRTWLVYSELNAAGSTSTNLSFVHNASLESTGYNHNNSAAFYQTDVGNWRPKACGPEVSGAYGLPSAYYSQTIASVELPTCSTCANPANGVYFTKSTCQSTILPIQLDIFKAVLNNCAVQLSWNTVSEANSKAFIIERKINNGNWQAIATVTAIGNSSKGAQYKYSDNISEDGKLFYRLKMVDEDGAYRYSNTEALSRNCNLGMVQVYPNPVSDVLTIVVPSTYKNSSARLYNSMGQLVTSVADKAGNLFKINVSTLSVGAYILVLFDGKNAIHKEKIIKY